MHLLDEVRALAHRKGCRSVIHALMHVENTSMKSSSLTKAGSSGGMPWTSGPPNRRRMMARTRNANIAARLIERASRHPDRLALVECHGRRVRRVTFGELAGRAAAMAARLRERGLAPGDRALLFVPMSIDLYTAFVACLSVGAAVVFVDAWADRRRLDAAVERARPSGPSALLEPICSGCLVAPSGRSRSTW